MTALHDTCHPLVPDNAHIEEIANRKINLMFTLHLKTGKNQKIGLDSVPPSYPIQNEFLIHRLEKVLDSFQLIPDDDLFEKVKEKYGPYGCLPDAVTEILLWKAFQKGLR